MLNTQIIHVQDLSIGGAFVSEAELHAALAALFAENVALKELCDWQQEQLERLRAGEAAARIVFQASPPDFRRDVYDDTNLQDSYGRQEL